MWPQFPLSPTTKPFFPGVNSFAVEKYLGSRGLVSPNLWENYLLIEIVLSCRPPGKLATIKRNLLGVKLAESGSPKPRFSEGEQLD